MKHKKFMDIERLKTNYADGFQKGDHIVIQEKIDGANAAIRYDSETDTLVAQSRKNILDPTNNLRGFYEFVQRLDKDNVQSVLGENLILFCEWLVKHTVPYPDEKYNNAYCYDVYDTNTEQYLPQSTVKEIVNALGLIYVPIFYDGEFISWEHCNSFVGKTELGGEYGEGIVVKNITRLNDPNTRLPFYTKIVGESFQEHKRHREPKLLNPDIIKAREEAQELAETIVTEGRVRKLLNKFVDEGIIPEDWSITDMGIIAKHLGKEIYNDCLKEEKDIILQINNFGKVANSIAMRIARDIANTR